MSYTRYTNLYDEKHTNETRSYVEFNDVGSADSQSMQEITASETTSNDISVNELIDWYLQAEGDELGIGIDDTTDSFEITHVAANSSLHDKLKKYVDNNHLVYADTGEDIQHISINQITINRNKFYLGNRQIITNNNYIRNGIYVFAQSGRYVDLSRKEIENLPVVKGKKMLHGQEIITERAFQGRNNLVFATNGVKLTENEKKQIVLGEDGKRYLDGIEIITKFAFYSRNALVFSTTGVRLNELEKIELILTQDKYINGIEVVTESFYESHNLVFASNGVFLTEDERQRVVIDENKKKYLDGVKVVTKHYYDRKNTLVFATNGVRLTELEKNQVITDESGHQFLANKKVINAELFRLNKQLVFAEDGANLTDSQMAQLKKGEGGTRYLDNKGITAANYKIRNQLVFADTGIKLNKLEKMQVEGHRKKTLNGRKVITKVAWKCKQKLVFAETGKFLTPQERALVVKDANGYQKLNGKEVITHNALTLRKRNLNRKDILKTLVFEDGTPLTEEEKQIKGKSRKYQNRKVIRYGTYLEHSIFQFTSGPDRGRELSMEEKKRMNNGYCDEFTVEFVGTQQVSKKRKTETKEKSRKKQTTMPNENPLNADMLELASVNTVDNTSAMHEVPLSTLDDESLRNIYSSFATSGFGFFSPPSPTQLAPQSSFHAHSKGLGMNNEGNAE